jgi:hypothetical protein
LLLLLPLWFSSAHYTTFNLKIWKRFHIEHTHFTHIKHVITAETNLKGEKDDF